MKTKQRMEEMGVTIIHSKPDVFYQCEEKFGISWDNTIFACDPYIHTSHEIDDDIIEHELIHIRQQREVGGVDKWWDMYFKVEKNRLDWEMEAYRHQYRFLKNRNTHNKQQMFERVSLWADNLSGEGYGHLISKTDAIKQIMT